MFTGFCYPECLTAGLRGFVACPIWPFFLVRDGMNYLTVIKTKQTGEKKL